MDLEHAVAAAWEEASEDLGIAVSIHGALHDSDGRAYPYTVHIVEFGGANGTICVSGGAPAETRQTRYIG